MAKPPRISGNFVFGSDFSEEDEEADLLRGKSSRDTVPIPSLPRHSSSNMNLPFRRSGTDRMLDCCASYLTPFALCSMGKNPFKPWNMKPKYRSSKVMDQSAMALIKHKKKDAKQVLKNINSNHTAGNNNNV